MARYIDADALIAYLYDYQDCDIDIPKEIAEFPTADVRENVRGEWMKDGRYMGKNWHRCSICDRAYSYVYDWNFCPNCGADMRGEK